MSRRARKINPGQALGELATPKELVRLLSKVERDAETGCWLWQGATDPQGYGVFRWRAKVIYAHRAVCEWIGRGLDDGEVVNHLCGCRSCCNPQHLEPTTVAANAVYRAGA